MRSDATSDLQVTLDELARLGGALVCSPIPESVIPGLRRAGTVAGTLGIGIAASACSAHQTGRRVGMRLEQDNPTATQSQLVHSGTGTLSGWAGATGTAFVVGCNGVMRLALAAADAYWLSEGFERGAMLPSAPTRHPSDRPRAERAAQITLGSGLRLSDPEHRAYDNYEQTRCDRLTHINDIKPKLLTQLLASTFSTSGTYYRHP